MMARLTTVACAISLLGCARQGDGEVMMSVVRARIGVEPTAPIEWCLWRKADPERLGLTIMRVGTALVSLDGEEMDVSDELEMWSDSLRPSLDIEPDLKKIMELTGYMELDDSARAILYGVFRRGEACPASVAVKFYWMEAQRSIRELRSPWNSRSACLKQLERVQGLVAPLDSGVARQIENMRVDIRGAIDFSAPRDGDLAVDRIVKGLVDYTDYEVLRRPSNESRIVPVEELLRRIPFLQLPRLAKYWDTSAVTRLVSVSNTVSLARVSELVRQGASRLAHQQCETAEDWLACLHQRGDLR